MSQETILTEDRITGIDRFVGRVLDAFRAGNVSRRDAIGAIGHVTSAIDKRNETEITNFPDLWQPDTSSERRNAFLSAMEGIALRVSQPESFKAALEAADDWRAAATEQAKAGDREFFIYQGPGKLTNEQMLDLSEMLEAHGFTMTQRRSIIERARTACSSR
ncbi:hypothetical protein [Burkholderia cepacia]|uniref:hypothetical protein n=1 Tax=Burkholderia cepacia TaxID=292 RepID=UPI0012D96191|nr:hypothetical protein [Burkholderia cepacia]